MVHLGINEWCSRSNWTATGKSGWDGSRRGIYRKQKDQIVSVDVAGHFKNSLGGRGTSAPVLRVHSGIDV